MEKTFIEDESLVELANEVISEKKLDYLSSLNIKFVLVSPYISKTCVGKCIKPNNELKYFGEFDYLIEFSELVWNGLKDDVKKILMYHELKHILITTDKKGETKYKIADHDVKDFFSIIKENGIDWFDTLKVTAASVYDFQNGEQDKIKI